jgi:hypothetical protein
MSLVGSLEDLGLGDILQIVSLSRKSGLLVLRSDAGEGRIILQDGQVRGAFVKGEPEDLQTLLVGGGFLEASAFEAARERSSAGGRPLDETLESEAGLAPERLDSLRREHVERAVLRMFTWRTGQFSFEVRDELEARDAELSLRTGINAQYLTMEATRLRDEKGDAGPASGPDFEAGDEADGEEAAPDEDPVFSGEEQAEDAEEAEEAEESEEPRRTPASARIAPVSSVEEAREALAMAAARRAERSASLPEPLPAMAEVEPAPPAFQPPACLIVIDPDLQALEWVKSVLTDRFERIHIFQRPDAGVGRIRQYLGRAERPLVLLSTRAGGDPLSGAANAPELVARLKQLAPQMPILWLKDRGGETPVAGGMADGVVARPPVRRLTNRAGWAELEAEAASLRMQLAPWTSPGAGPSPIAAAATPEPASPRRPVPLKRLKQVCTRLRDPNARGDVLSLVIEFASEFFSRVAMFMLRDDVIVGIAQSGLDRAGGPGDEELRRLRMPASDSAWLRAAIGAGDPVQAAPSDAGDRRLVALLGSGMPKEAYLGPIHSGGRVAALLYADDLPEGRPLGDTSSLTVVLREAGLALDRALEERALAENSRP